MKHRFFTLGTALLLLPVFAATAQTIDKEAQFSGQSDEVHESSTQPSESAIETDSVIQTQADREDRWRRSQITADLLNIPHSQTPRLLLHCRQAHSFDRPVDRHEYTSHSTIRELLSNREEQETIIEIHGNCNDIRIQIETTQQAEPHRSYPQSHSSPGWNEELPRNDWLTRTGSGWDWFLRQNATPPASNQSLSR